ncbi:MULTISPECIES: hypothetical protein [unclassified Granulicatella]|uniref:hypothetical protein n=1 Tax=unclassified Granulicatella TaxID=2630493 RepID=UPI001074938B|nr:MULTISPECIES: hypothetical protein [unclassified Granulicatella]MBF0780680.1 hypothetical protein [Granulicatella sp. 19428wC4_WM01]TFU94257.1 hypothetical protein E4T68_06180 [Granulicatella sp. WM01]
MNVEKVKEWVNQYKVHIGSGIAVALLFSGVVVFGLSGKKQEIVKVESTTTKATTQLSVQSQMTKSSREIAQESKVESMLAVEVSADTNVAEIEKEIDAIENQQDKVKLQEKLAEVKEQVKKKQQEHQATQLAQATTQAKENHNSAPRQDETSQPVVQSKPTYTQRSTQTPTPVQTQAVVQTTQAPVTTTVQTTQKPVETTQATTQKHRIGSLGNSGMEFATMEEAEKWAESKRREMKKGYWIDVVVYSDGTVTYTIDWH